MSGSITVDDNALRALRSHLARSRRVLQPLRDDTGNLRWLPASTDSPLPGLGARPAFPAKAELFAERENLFVFDGTRFRETTPAPEPSVLFGASACDLAAIAYQDRFFAEDPWYRARRQSLLLVGIDCIAPCDGGFCPLTDSGPFVRATHADIVLHPPAAPGDDWRVFVMSAAGVRALDGLSAAAARAVRDGDLAREKSVTTQCDHARRDFLDAHEPAVAARFDTTTLARGVAAINGGGIPRATWQRLGTECITCGGCSTVCPTCSCFATQQESSGDTATTVRFWDSCLYENFQREASGHNPTAEAGARIARFWTHKFGDDFVTRYGHYTCVGCGRCDAVCPSGIGARSTLSRLSGAGNTGENSA